MTLTVEQKEKIRVAMNTYLTAQGWPNMPNPDGFVMQQLPNLWRHLDTEGLIPKGATYQIFAKAANQALNFSNLSKHFGGTFGFGF